MLNLLTCCIFFKNSLNNLRRFRFYEQCVLSIHFLTTIPVRSFAPNVLSVFLHNTFGRPLLCRNIFCVGIIYQIFNIHGQILIFWIWCKWIILIAYGNKAHFHKRQYFFQIISCFDIVSPKSRKVLYQNAIYFSFPDVLHHPLKARSFKICPSFPNVRINIIQSQFIFFVRFCIMGLNKFLYQSHLCFNGFHLFFILIYW